MATEHRTAPGVYTGTSLNHRNIFVNDDPRTTNYAPSTMYIDGAKARDTGNSPVSLLRAGLILGKVGSTNLMANSIIGLTGVLHDTSATPTVLTLPAAVVTEIARRIGTSGTFKIIGPPTAAGTVATETVTFSAIATSTTITITATSADFAAGSIIAPADGSEAPKTVLVNPYGIDVVATDGTNLKQALDLYLTGADLKATQIISLTEGDASVQTWIKTQLKAAGRFTFDNDR